MRASASAVLAAVIILVTGCTVGDGPVTTEGRPVRPFDAIEVGSGIRLSMRIGSEHAIEVSAQENLLEAIGTEVRGSSLVIEAHEDFTSTEPIVVTIVAPSLTSITMSSGARADIEGLTVDDLALDIRGGASASISGTVDHLDLEVDGGATAELADFVARTISLRADGGGIVTVNASTEVTGSASGGARLTVLGDATVTVDTSGGANVARE